MGAMGKSAQFLLHTWLPDAMEGPTPVSALIHAATMVTAGVFMVARLSPLFELAPVALQVVTLRSAPSPPSSPPPSGLVQNDIKRVIAYSTCSQLGYMFVACGVGAYAAGIFHLFTHAFFKALLFLGSGSVIHAMHHEQDMRKMGGLAGKIPFTYVMMLIGTLSLTASAFRTSPALPASTPRTPSSRPPSLRTRRHDYAFWLLVDRRVHDRLLFLAADLHDVPRRHARRPPTPTSTRTRARSSCWSLLVPGLGIRRRRLAFRHTSSARATGVLGRRVRGRAQPHPARAARGPAGSGWAPTLAMLGGFALSYSSTSSLPSLPARSPRACRPIYLFLLNRWYFDELYDCAVRAPRVLDRPLLWKRRRRRHHRRLGPDGVAARVL